MVERPGGLALVTADGDVSASAGQELFEAMLACQQLSRIATMTTSQIATRDDTVHVRLGEHDVPVPEPLGKVLTELARNGRAYTGTGSPTQTDWLFPGGLPGKPITASRLGERLRALGISAQAGTPRSPNRLGRPTTRRRARRPPRPRADHSRQMDATGRRRLVRLRRRTRQSPQSQSMTNTTQHTTAP